MGRSRARMLALVCSLGGATAYTLQNQVAALITGEINPKECVALEKNVDDKWCLDNCGNVPPNCPSTLCDCTGAAKTARDEQEADAAQQEADAAQQEADAAAEEKQLKKSDKKHSSTAAKHEAAAAKREEEPEAAAENTKEPKEEKSHATNEPQLSPLAKSLSAAINQTAVDNIPPLRRDPATSLIREPLKSGTKAVHHDVHTSKLDLHERANKTVKQIWGDGDSKDTECTEGCDDGPQQPVRSALPPGGDSTACTANIDQVTVDDAWCVLNCGIQPYPNCPFNLCTCANKEDIIEVNPEEDESCDTQFCRENRNLRSKNSSLTIVGIPAQRNPNTGLRVTGDKVADDLGRFLPRKAAGVGTPSAGSATIPVPAGNVGAKSALPEGGDPSTCYALENQTKGTDDWCLDNCGALVSVCPDSKCVCGLKKSLGKPIKDSKAAASAGNPPDPQVAADAVKAAEDAVIAASGEAAAAVLEPAAAVAAPLPAGVGEKSALNAGADPSTCYAVEGQTQSTDDWCLDNCGASVPICPDSKCVCGLDKKAEMAAQTAGAREAKAEEAVAAAAAEAKAAHEEGAAKRDEAATAKDVAEAARDAAAAAAAHDAAAAIAQRKALADKVTKSDEAAREAVAAAEAEVIAGGAPTAPDPQDAAAAVKAAEDAVIKSTAEAAAAMQVPPAVAAVPEAAEDERDMRDDLVDLPDPPALTDSALFRRPSVPQRHVPSPAHVAASSFDPLWQAKAMPPAADPLWQTEAAVAAAAQPPAADLLQRVGPAVKLCDDDPSMPHCGYDKSAWQDMSGLKGSAPATCAAVEGSGVGDDWCRQNCGGSPPNCPAKLCMCGKAAEKANLLKVARSKAVADQMERVRSSSPSL